MNEKHTSLYQAERYYSDMLLRQYPWLKNQMADAEYPVSLSFRKPELLFGSSALFVGCFILLDTLLHMKAFGGLFPGLLLILIGSAMIYAGVWAIFFVKKGYVFVTSQRIEYQKVDLLGRPGKTLILPRSEIQSARFLKGTVMYFIKRCDGDISITTKSGKTILIPGVRDAENILGALR